MGKAGVDDLDRLLTAWAGRQLPENVAESIGDAIRGEPRSLGASFWLSLVAQVNATTMQAIELTQTAQATTRQSLRPSASSAS